MRILHTMIRVGNLEQSIIFYRDILGMNLLRLQEYPQEKFTLAFLGYGDEAQESVIELTYNWDQNSYELGTGFGHIAIGVDDVYKTCEVLKEKGGNVVREAGPMKGGSSVIAFLEDPDGYKIELIGLRSMQS